MTWTVWPSSASGTANPPVPPPMSTMRACDPSAVSLDPRRRRTPSQTTPVRTDWRRSLAEELAVGWAMGATLVARRAAQRRAHTRRDGCRSGWTRPSWRSSGTPGTAVPQRAGRRMLVDPRVRAGGTELAPDVAGRVTGRRDVGVGREPEPAGVDEGPPDGGPVRIGQDRLGPSRELGAHPVERVVGGAGALPEGVQVGQVPRTGGPQRHPAATRAPQLTAHEQQPG